MHVDAQLDKLSNGHHQRYLGLVPISVPQIIQHNWKWTILNYLMKGCTGVESIFVIHQLEIWKSTWP